MRFHLPASTYTTSNLYSRNTISIISTDNCLTVLKKYWLLHAEGELSLEKTPFLYQALNKQKNHHWWLVTGCNSNFFTRLRFKEALESQWNKHRLKTHPLTFRLKRWQKGLSHSRLFSAWISEFEGEHLRNAHRSVSPWHGQKAFFLLSVC